MQGDGWIAALTALLLFLATTIFLAVSASRWSASANGTFAVSEQGEEEASGLALVCVSAIAICHAPPLPAGYPCTCQHPLRGTVQGWVASAEGEGIGVARERLPESSTFDGFELVFP
jgi:hypothetical protein